MRSPRQAASRLGMITCPKNTHSLGLPSPRSSRRFMYNAFFRFSESPFNLSPDPRFLYRSPQHEEALANLFYGVQTRKGFIVLTGDAGTGKTTLLECLREFLNAQHIVFASLFNSRLT